MSEAANVLMVRPDGPNVVTGDLVIVTPTRVREMKTAVLCRCGHSQNKPFCDSTHKKINFQSEVSARDLPPPEPKPIS